jgi:hypothetical protein
MLKADWHMDEDFMDNLQRLTTGPRMGSGVHHDGLGAKCWLAQPPLIAAFNVSRSDHGRSGRTELAPRWRRSTRPSQAASRGSATRRPPDDQR